MPFYLRCHADPCLARAKGERRFITVESEEAVPLKGTFPVAQFGTFARRALANPCADRRKNSFLLDALPQQCASRSRRFPVR